VSALVKADTTRRLGSKRSSNQTR